MSETNTILPPIDWAAWMVESRKKTKCTQEEFADLLGENREGGKGLPKSVVASAESGGRLASTELVNLVTYATMRGDPVGAAELMWSRALERTIKVSRPETAPWVYDLVECATDADPQFLAMAVHLFKTVLIEAKANAARFNGRRITDVLPPR